MSRSSGLYMRRKQLAGDVLRPRPLFRTHFLATHFRPNDPVLPALRAVTGPASRLGSPLLEETRPYVRHDWYG